MLLVLSLFCLWLHMHLIRMDDQDGKPGSIQNTFCHASHHPISQASTTMGRHGDQITSSELFALLHAPACFGKRYHCMRNVSIQVKRDRRGDGETLCLFLLAESFLDRGEIGLGGF